MPSFKPCSTTKPPALPSPLDRGASDSTAGPPLALDQEPGGDEAADKDSRDGPCAGELRGLGRADEVASPVALADLVGEVEGNGSESEEEQHGDEAQDPVLGWLRSREQLLGKRLGGIGDRSSLSARGFLSRLWGSGWRHRGCAHIGPERRGRGMVSRVSCWHHMSRRLGLNY